MLLDHKMFLEFITMNCFLGQIKISKTIGVSLFQEYQENMHLKTKQTPRLGPASELYRPRECRFSAELVRAFADKECQWSARRIPKSVF
jgi:hypothetical protein